MITEDEREAGLRAYEQVQAFAALRRKKLPLVYAFFPALPALAGVESWRAGMVILAWVCWACAVLFTLFAVWNWRRLRAHDSGNRALLAQLYAQHGDDLPWLEVERHLAALEKLKAETQEIGPKSAD